MVKRGVSAHQKIYQVLCANMSKSLSQRIICERTGVSQPFVSKVLTELEREDNLYVNRNAVPVTYKLKRLIPGIEAVHSTHRVESEVQKGLSSNELHAFLETWAKATWEPKVNKSLRNLPHGVAALYSTAVEAMYGAEVTPRDIDKIRTLFYETRQDVVKVLEVIDRFLATTEVWDPKDMALFLAGNRDVEKIQNLTHRVREVN